ncbi:MAG: hypothetical protein EB165_06575, partial [Euryarchaeota archaeon]|nr:hypothetical protein [Euryarchaeota archaeon]NDB94287.1 hypothetical protein [Euryarchaeota archaeon]
AGDFHPGAGLFDLEHVTIEQSAWNVRFTIKMAEITNGWNMMWGWSHANIQVYVDSAPGGKIDLLPGTYAQTSPDWGWESAVMLVGEAGPVYGVSHDSSTRITTGIEANGNPETDTIVATVSKNILQGDLASSRFLIVVGSQDGYGQGKLRAVDEAPSTWTAGGGAAPNAENLEKYHPTIWDVLLPESIDQQSMLGSYDVDMMSYAKLEGVELPPIQQQVYGLDAIGVSGSSALLSWSTAKSGDMRVVVTGESGTVIDETWASETSDNLRVIGGLTAGSSYTATVMAEGASESVEFVTGVDHDQSAPEVLGATYEEDSGNYLLSFYTTEPSSIVIEVCTNTSCTNISRAEYPTDRVHDYVLPVPIGNHSITVIFTDLSGNQGRETILQSGSLESNASDGSQGGEEEGPEDNDESGGQSALLALLSILVVVVALSAVVTTRRQKSQDEVPETMPGSED